MKEFNETMIKNYREFNNGGIFEIEGYAVKFNNNTKEIETDYPYAEELRVWWFNIEQETEETEKLKIADIEGLEFEVVDTFPKDYVVWNINTTSEYLPLCEVSKDNHVNVDTLKCIKLKSAEDVHNVLRSSSYLKNVTPRKLSNYLKRYADNCMSLATVLRVKRVTNALEAFKKVGIE